ncbi:2-oxoglutarate-dependent dioxygenase DAO-like [Lycium ferocissimum]|uniref:2-oxoglutarate-dependent dioxygenase DAO-like n=1 Tax=Lycium ferocissimum TaxID=112874 RepID=UPI002815B544|nr:2-oxoglutarate-dependent dioxygenase DAO-like [Lycium ferocissimum]
MAKSLPIIDMQHSIISDEIVKSLERWGCFRLVNHGVPPSFLSEIMAVGRALMELPVEMKGLNVHKDKSFGYIPVNMTSAMFESLGVYDATLPEDVDHFCAQLNLFPHQREVMVKYSEAIYDLTKKLGSKLMEGFGLESGDLFKDWPCLMKFNKYNNNFETVGLTGATTHSDKGFFTILLDDELVNGLEMLDDQTGEFIPANPIPGSFFVNAGDIAKAWSNGRICNVRHRVQCNEPRVRYSVTFFVLGPRNEKMETPSKLVDYQHPPLYVPFHFEEYCALRTSTKSIKGEVLDLFRKK